MEGFRFGWFYAAGQSLTYAVLALGKLAVLCRLQQGLSILSGVSMLYGSVLAGISMTVSHGCGVAAFVHINYSTAMVFKSAKVPSVMVGATCMNRQRPSIAEQLWAFLMMLGLILFGLGDKLESPRFSAVGVFLITVNLIGSSLTANLQQRVLQGSSKTSETVEILMLVQYAVSAFLLFLYTACTGELISALDWYRSAPSSTALATVADHVLSYIGLEAVMRITGEFDATRANVVCSGRKAVTFVFSYCLFPKPFGALHAIGLPLVLFGGFQLHRAKSHRKLPQS
eukprot:gnl/MRDRNA2_/MRDRNA2_39428_c0_seq2.p1 gnl/MRDRNA2_/MRDRNA2_39428_c0~~gnl/MRDRNA2_/MRDRNA2_39428_c0_seq2.p1  ORF type:complete len:285 (+),score=39.54 gnl/MRDRNA2_/MRDRNA2_39428_c0_seq2:1-855(+)